MMAVASFVAADLPVHCLHKHVSHITLSDPPRHPWLFNGSDYPYCLFTHHSLLFQVVGDWTFHRSKGGQTRSVLQSCNRANDYLGGGDFGLGDSNYEVEDEMHVKLESPNKATAWVKGARLDGTWTMMYDEGFEVMVGGEKVTSPHQSRVHD